VHPAKVDQLRGQTGEFRRGSGQFNGPSIDFIQSQFDVEIFACSVHHSTSVKVNGTREVNAKNMPPKT
jgi:hypothetical protein